MKWIILGVAVFMSGCYYTEAITYKQVTVAPTVEPVLISTDRQKSIDVTTTTISYY